MWRLLGLCTVAVRIECYVLRYGIVPVAGYFRNMLPRSGTCCSVDCPASISSLSLINWLLLLTKTQLVLFRNIIRSNDNINKLRPNEGSKRYCGKEISANSPQETTNNKTINPMYHKMQYEPNRLYLLRPQLGLLRLTDVRGSPSLDLKPTLWYVSCYRR